MFLVKLEKGVWLASWQGDPGRTLKKTNAKTFTTEEKAQQALYRARLFRRFEKAKVVPNEDPN